MKKLTLVALALCAAALTGCGDSDEAKRVRAVFITSCMSGGTSQGTCECAHEYLAEEYSLEEIETISSPYEVLSPNVIQDLTRYALQCRGK